MARKSREIRIQQARKLLSDYQVAMYEGSMHDWFEVGRLVLGYV